MSDSLQREQAIFDGALELPPAERVAYLDEVTRGDGALRDRLNELLKGYEAGTFLESSTAAVSRRTIRASETPAEPGEKIGRYKLLQTIGEGGCGVVYMAEQEEPVCRRVALKIIKLGMDTKSVIARFEAERQALALMDHPNIAKVFDAGATETGRPYFVMELVRGMKITEYCDEAKLSIPARLELFIEVCHAVQHAHQKGIIHRDLKPSNILVTINDGVPVPKVIDFGIAKATGGQRLTDKTIFTAFEQFIGTPAYMSPEQAILTSVDVDTRSDIYALGVLLYELLSGKTPFDAQDLLAIGLDEMRRTIREKEPERPSTRLSTLAQVELSTTAQRRGIDAPKLLSNLRGDLDWIVMKCLEKDRTRRYETASGLATDIQRHLSNEPVIARPPNAWYRLQKLARRNKLAFAAATAVSASLFIGIVVSTTLFLKEKKTLHRALAAESKTQDAIAEAKRQRDEAVKQKEHANEQAAIAEAVKNFLQSDLLEQADIGNQADRGFEVNPNLTVKEALNRGSERISQRFLSQPEVEAEIRITLGGAFSALEEPRLAVTNFERAVALYEQVLGSDDPKTLVTMRRLAKVYEQAGRSTEAALLWHKTLKLQEKKLGTDHPDTLKTRTQVARLIRWSGKIAEGISLQEETLRQQKAKLGPNHPDTLESMFWLAVMYNSSGRRVEAVALQEERLSAVRAALGPGHPFTLEAEALLASGYRNVGRRAEGTKLLGEVLQRLSAQSGSAYDANHRLALQIMLDLASDYEQSGRPADAEKLYHDVLTTALENPPQTSDQLNFRVWIFAKLNRWKEAAADLGTAIRLNPDRIGDWVSLAATFVQIGELDHYREHCAKFVERFAQGVERSTSNVDRDIAYSIARACLVLPNSVSNVEVISKMADRALSLETANAGTNDSFWLYCSSTKSLAEYREGRFASAADWAERTLASRPDLLGCPTWLEVETYAVLAMSRHQLKQGDLAEAALTRGKQIAAEKLPELESQRLGLGLIITEKLMREAQGLIDGASRDIR